MAKTTYDFPADASFEGAASEVLLSGFRKMAANIEGTRSGLEKTIASPDEIEALHDMRVGSRRMRAGLEVFGKLFSKSDFRRLKRELAGITDVLGAVRDLDVQLDALRFLATTLPPNEAYGIGKLVARQSARRDRESKLLLEELERLDKTGFRRRVKSLIKDAVSVEKSAGRGAKKRAAP